MEQVTASLRLAGHDPYCVMFDPDSMSARAAPGQVLCYALDRMREADAVVAIVASERRSEGQLIELGAAEAIGLPFYLFLHESAVGKSYLPELAAQTIIWSSPESLSEVVSSTAFEAVRDMAVQ